MNPTKILLLDLNPTASSSGALRAILESSPDGIELRREVVADNGAAPYSGELPEIISSFQPRLRSAQVRRPGIEERLTQYSRIST